MQAAQRRRKKRYPSHNLRTVELMRGRNGYGFTISGQQPCILSCIVSGSPADRAGLKTGDYLMSVNSMDISSAPHDDVVRLIGSSMGSLLLQIAENYNNDSDSSDDEYQAKPKTKYPNRARLRQAQSRGGNKERGSSSGKDRGYDKYGALSKRPISDLKQSSRYTDPIDDFTAEFHEALYSRGRHHRSKGVENQNPLAASGYPKRHKHSGGLDHHLGPVHLHGGASNSGGTKHTIITREYRMEKNNSNSFEGGARAPKPLHPHVQYSSPPAMTAQDLSDILYPSIQPHGEVRHRGNPAEGMANEPPRENVKRFIVGYIGSIEMPRDANLPSSRLQSIRSAVRRLRVEQKVHTLVMMDVGKYGVTLQNAIGNTVATYDADKLAFSGVCPDDKRFFGIVTFQTVSENGQRQDESMSGSACHVFMVDPDLSSHRVHAQRAKNFGIQCTVDPETQKCFEFPHSASPLLTYILNLYRDQGSVVQVDGRENPVVGNQHERQESASSNSDSGLGFARDDKGNTDQVCVVELPAQNEASFSGNWDLEESGSSAFALYRAKMEQDFSSIMAPGLRCPGSGASDSSPGLSQNNTPNSSNNDSACSHVDKMSVRALPSKGAPGEHLDARNSADNLRKSMHRYLQSQQRLSENGSDIDSHSIRSTDSASSHSQTGMDSSCRASGDTLGTPLSQKSLNSQQSGSSFSSTISAVSEHSGNHDNSGSNDAKHLSQHKLSPRVFSSGLTQTVGERRSGAIPVAIPSIPGMADDRPSAFKVPTFKPPLPNTRPPLPGKLNKPPVPGRKPGLPRSHFRTPPQPSQVEYSHRPKSTPPFRQPRDLSPSSSDNDYDSDPGSICRKPPSSRPPQMEWTNVFTDMQVRQDPRRFSEGFHMLKKRDTDEESIASSVSSRVLRGSSMKQPKSKKWTSRSNSHDSLVVTENPCLDESRLSCATSAHHISKHVEQEENGNIPIGRAASWAVDFEKLLRDLAGLATFTEFLKKEFSEENIEFWVKCREYKEIKDGTKRASRAKEIFDEHLCPGASSPVNVDSHALQVTQEGLDEAGTNLFDTAKEQIFRLMKLDSYSRFLKSELYKQCVVAEMEGRPLPYTGESKTGGQQGYIKTPLKDKSMKEDKKVTFVENITKSTKNGFSWKLLRKSKSSVSNTEEEGQEKRRRSLMLPWNKKSEKKMVKMNTDTELLNKNKSLKRDERRVSTSSLSSSASLELADLNKISKELNLDPSRDSYQAIVKENQKFCRVILPDGSTTVIYAKPGQSIKAVLQRLCDRRNLVLATLEVAFVEGGNNKLVDLSKDVSTLGSREIQMEKQALFCVDLPNRKTIAARARPERTIEETLKPVLQKHGVKLDDMVVHVSGTGVLVDTETAISAIDNQRVAIQSMEDFQDWGGFGRHRSKPPLPGSKSQGSDVEHEQNAYTIVQGWFDVKAATNLLFDDLGVLDPNQKPDESHTESKNSGLLGLIRRNSIGDRDGKKPKNKTSKVVQEKNAANKAPTPAKRTTKTSQADDNKFLELLCKVQGNRLDDQRGLSAQGLELPDFLKLDNKVNTTPGGLHRPKSAIFDTRQMTRSDSMNSDSSIFEESSKMRLTKSSASLTMDNISSFGTSEASLKLLGTPRSNKIPYVDQSFSSDGIVPHHIEAEQYFANSTQPTTPSLNFDDSQLMEKSLSDIGMSKGSGNGYVIPMSKATSHIAKPAPRQQKPVPAPRNLPSKNMQPQLRESSQTVRPSQARRSLNLSLNVDDDNEAVFNAYEQESEDEHDQTIQAADSSEFVPPPPVVTQDVLDIVHPGEIHYPPPSPFQTSALDMALDDYNNFRSPSSRRVQRFAPKRTGQPGESQPGTSQQNNPGKSLPDCYSFSEEQSHLSIYNEYASAIGPDSGVEPEMSELNLQGPHSVIPSSTPSPTTHDLILELDSENDLPPPEVYFPVPAVRDPRSKLSPLENFLHFEGTQEYQASYV